jgi:hypothetical protein
MTVGHSKNMWSIVSVVPGHQGQSDVSRVIDR